MEMRSGLKLCNKPAQPQAQVAATSTQMKNPAKPVDVILQIQYLFHHFINYLILDIAPGRCGR